MQDVRGFLSNKWMTLAGTYYNCPNPEITTRHDGGNRVQRTLKALHRLMTDLWCGRNEALHDSNVAMEHNLTDLVDVEISTLHQGPDALLSADNHYCDISLRRLLRSSASTKRRWLHRVKQSRAKKTALQAKQPRITKFFNREPVPPNNPYHPPPNQTIPSPPSSRNYNTQERLLTEYFQERINCL